ncbi:hypothetical protein L484_008841 [Morus notabilis]|uniref:Uncharacterized protein n=1 Tax=Morus notabilis TaxID=981085 RepID=W9R2Z2_9ROSA|nr:hypothetical protein L484_008841 [Morus notabilis]
MEVVVGYARCGSAHRGRWVARTFRCEGELRELPESRALPASCELGLGGVVGAGRRRWDGRGAGQFGWMGVKREYDLRYV